MVAAGVRGRGRECRAHAAEALAGEAGRRAEALVLLEGEEVPEVDGEDMVRLAYHYYYYLIN